MLADLIRSNRERYRRQLLGEEPAGWDYVVLTAANAAQARGYALEVARYQRAGWLPAGVEYLVVPDPAGRHLGSGGAAAYALRIVAARWGVALGLLPGNSDAATEAEARLVEASMPGRRSGGEADKGDSLPRVLVVNSGGDSKRIPHCATFGKAFAGLPFPLFPDGPGSTVFTELLVSVCGLTWPPDGGAVVLSGDVLLAFDPGQVTVGGGVTGLASRSPWELAARHGVYVCPPQGGRVQGFLQKPSYDEMQAAGALVDEQALLDTGLLAFDAQATRRLVSLAGVQWTEEDLNFGPGILDQPGQEQAQIDLYTDICLALAGPSCLTPQPPLPAGEGERGPATAQAEKVNAVQDAVRRALAGLEFSVAVPDPAGFVHLGTTAEWLDFCCGQLPEARWYDPQVSAIYQRDSLIGSLQARPPAVIHYCRLPWLEVGERGLVSGVEDEEGLALPVGAALSLVPLACAQGEEKRWVAQIYGVDDNPKALFSSGHATYLEQPLADWIVSKGMSADDLWPHMPPESRSLWNARLFVPGTATVTLRWALWLLEQGNSKTKEEWRRLPRLSLEEGLRLVDAEALHRQRARLAGQRLGTELVELIGSDQWAGPLLGRLGSEAEIAEAAASLLRHLEEEGDSFRRARAYQMLSDLLGEERLQQVLAAEKASAAANPVSDLLFRSTRRRFGTAFEAAGWLEEEAFREVSAAVAEGVPSLGEAQPPRLVPGRSAIVRAPARVDFGGGWSDTPPFSLERGGAVLNAAVRLDGQLPILAHSEVLEQPVLELVSEDAGVSQIILEPTDLLTCGPGDPLALHKAALILGGLAGSGPGGDLPEFLRRCGGGLRLTTRIDLPQGSGLGTSSIAAAALLRCLDLLLGREFSCEDLNGRVLYLEQLITTGGGWQDQLGGMIPGVKLLETAPGKTQQPRVSPVTMSARTAEQLHRRLLVCFVGERRVAKNILHQIMRRWLSRAPEVVRVLHEIKDIARAMKAALEAGDLDQFGRLMAHHWQLNKLMDRQTTTPHVEGLFAALGDLAVGAKLVGAGGGGFMEIVAKDEQAAGRIREQLTPVLVDKGGRFYDVAVAEEGLVEEANAVLGGDSL